MSVGAVLEPRIDAPKAVRPRKVLVTGAAGCVGHFLVEELLERGDHVVAVDRPGLAFEHEGEAGLDARGVDLRDSREAARAVRGADAVIHAAAIVDISMPFEELRAINLDSVRALYEAAVREGCSDFIFFSSGSVYAPSAAMSGKPITEDAALEASSDYERTKMWAEEYLRSRPAGGPRVAILRPALVFGPAARVLGAALATVPPLLERWGGFIPKLRGGPRTNWVHARDVARAALYLLDHPQDSGSVFNVSNDEALSLGEYLTIASEVAGVKLGRSILEVPDSMMRLLGLTLQPKVIRSTVNAVTRRLWGSISRKSHLTGQLAPRIDREMLVYLANDVIFDNSKLKATGFRLSYPRFEPAWRETIEWYRTAGWLPRANTPAPRRDRGKSGPRQGFRFAETMSGTVGLDGAARDGAQGEHQFSFTVTAVAESQRAFWLGGQPLRLHGTATIEGIATRQPARGTLELSPFLRRELVYELEFTSDRGEKLRYFGRKRISARRLLSSWTTLRGALLQDGMPIGKSTLRFDLRDLPGLMLSFRPW